MTRVELINSATRAFHRVTFKLQKHSPEILIVAGVIGTVASAVMACRATLKAGEVLDEAKEAIDEIHDAAASEAFKDSYPEEQRRKDLTDVYVKTGLKFVRLYGPAVALGTLSLTGVVASNHILRKRNIALASAYAIVDSGFKEYRGRVVERFGKDLDRELKYNIKAKEVEEIVVHEDGTQETVKTTVEVAEPNFGSDYARFFCEGCAGWEKDAEHNLYFLRCQQNYANDLLRTRGHVFLNEVYDMLGIQRTKAGNVVGWVYDEDCPNGDNFIDFGIYDVRDERKRAFVNGYERSILLDFNVDGNILELMA